VTARRPRRRSGPSGDRGVARPDIDDSLNPEIPIDMSTRKPLEIAQTALLALGLCLFGYALLTFLDGAAHQRQAMAEIRSARSADATVEAPLPGGTSETGLTVPEGHPIGVVRVPHLEMSVAVFEGTTDQTLRRGAGRIPGTAFPGQDGNVGIAGHRDGLFWDLQHLVSGDRIELITPSATWKYEVTGTTIVKPEDTSVLDPLPDRDLTLVTCYPFGYFGLAPERFIVHARKVGRTDH